MNRLDFKGHHFNIKLEVGKDRVSDIKKIKERTRTDLVVQDPSKTKLLFLEHIPEAEIIEETQNEI